MIRADPKMGGCWAGGSGPWPLVWWRGLGVGGGSGGLCLVCRAGSGDAGEGDFEAEGAEAADVAGDLAADVCAALVVVRAEVLVSHAGVGEQFVQHFELGVAGGDLGFGLAQAAGQPAVAGAF